MNSYKFKNFFIGLIQPFLISIYPVCMVMVASLDEVYIGEFAIYIGILFFSILFFYFIFGIFYKNWLKSSLFLSIAIIFFYGYHFFADKFLLPIVLFSEKHFFKLRLRYFFFIAFILLIFTFIKILKIRKINPIIIKFLIFPLLAVYLFFCFQYVSKLKNIDSAIMQWHSEENEFRNKYFKNINSDDLPDIYYIILDMFVSEKSLKNYFNLDLSWFFKKLKEKGFFVASGSYSNYPGTALSLSSSLNMHYLKKNFSGLMTHSVMYNNILYFLNSLGYKYYHILSESLLTCNPCRVNNKFSFKVYFSYCLRRMFVSFGFVSNVLGKWSLLNYFWLNFEVNRRRKSVLKQFKNLKNTIFQKSPKFIFSHIMVPHDPYMFDKNGNAVFKDLSGYPGQVEFAAKTIDKILDKILQNSNKKPIIILQADHGIPSFGTFSWKNFNGVQNLDFFSHQTFSILNSYYLPDGEYSSFYDSVSPVNSFRIIFNKYFGTNFEILPDRSFIAPKDMDFVCVDEFL